MVLLSGNGFGNQTHAYRGRPVSRWPFAGAGDDAPLSRHEGVPVAESTGDIDRAVAMSRSRPKPSSTGRRACSPRRTRRPAVRAVQERHLIAPGDLRACKPVTPLKTLRRRCSTSTAIGTSALSAPARTRCSLS